MSFNTIAYGSRIICLWWSSHWDERYIEVCYANTKHKFKIPYNSTNELCFRVRMFENDEKCFFSLYKIIKFIQRKVQFGEQKQKSVVFANNLNYKKS